MSNATSSINPSEIVEGHWRAAVEADVRKLGAELAAVRLRISQIDGGMRAQSSIAPSAPLPPFDITPIERQLAALEPRIATNERADRMAGWMSLAIYRLTLGTQAGDLRWHGGSSDFTWQGVAYDAPGFIDFAATELRKGA